MKHLRGWMIVAATAVFCPWNGFAQAPAVNDSTLQRADISAAIAFLEDSQKVAELTRRLRLLSEAQHLAGIALAPDAHRQKGKGRDNLISIGKKVVADWGDAFAVVVQEFQRLSGRVEALRTSAPFLHKRIISLLITVLLAVAIGFPVALLVWRTGRRLRGSDPAMQDGQSRMREMTAIIATRSAFGIGGSLGLYVISLFPIGSALRHFFSSMAAGYGIYTVVATLLKVFFSPNISRLRSIPCSDAAALQITGRCTMLLRVSLMMYLLYQTAGTLGLSIFCRLLIPAFQMIMTILVSVVLLRLRQWYLDPFRNHYNTRKKIPVITAVVDAALSNLFLLVFLYGITLMGVTLTGSAATYRYMIHGTVATVIVLLAGGFAVTLWYQFQHWIAGSYASLLSKYPELRRRFSGNVRIIGAAGYVIIGLSVIFFLIKMWGVPVEDLLASRVPVVQISLRIAAIVAGAWILLQTAYFIIGRFQFATQNRMSGIDGAANVEIEKRVSTLSDIFRKIVTLSIIVIGVIMILDEFGFDVKAMVAGVGIVGIAVGFGAQNLVRDFISGLFVIFENRIRVGDVAIINGTTGLVEQVNLRTSVLRGVDGTIHVFPNGEITSLSNMTHQYSYYVFDIGVAYKENTDRVVEVLTTIGEEIAGDPKYRQFIMEPLEILGVDAFADSAVIIKARIKTVPIKQWMIGREMNRRIKKRFDELGIEIPFPHRTIFFGDPGALPEAAMSAASSPKETSSAKKME